MRTRILAVDLEHDAEPGLAAQHTVIRFLRFHHPVRAKAARDNLHRFAVSDCGEDRLCAAHRRQRFGRVLCVAVDVVVGAELFCQLLFVAAAVDRNGAEALTRRELDSEMPTAADAVNGDDIAGTGASMAKSVKGGDAGA